ncbi:uncharacterized protein LOC124128161 isoform X1 [Haliotis rufescens]|uniref:uncharacterized protein LOC124128161 isoform X1 n=1 Tax=Haliotis rufescens TaxID=6454 RepID=UPI001EAFAE4D|nr:uncharacterized protein LOC124128161 isoform X1 [Haliotis rufescens]XP_048253522.1 uncharacterized protein LOC124128161 isoform X1 [Haliotis rufescens]
METSGLHTKFGCKCRNCYSYISPDSNETTDCAKCGCPPIDHIIMRNSPVDVVDDDADVSESSSDSGMPTASSEAVSGTTSFPLLGTTSWSSSDLGSLFDSKKRALDDVSAGPAKKKLKGTTTGQNADTYTYSLGIEGLLKLKPCKVLQKGHIPFTELDRIPYSVRGVYKIAYNWQTIYVGSGSCNVKQTLKSHFSGHGRSDLFEFIKSLSQRDLEKVTVYYLDETMYVHNCPKKSYMKCIEDMQGTKPKFNGLLPKKNTSKWWCNIQ